MTMRYTDAELRRILAQPGYGLVTDGAYTTLEPTPAARQLAQAERTKLEERFAATWQLLGGPPLTREHKFHPTRRWRFDFALPAAKLAYEVQGGLNQAQSGHRSRAGVQRDYAKSNAAQELGWTVYSVTSDNINDADTMAGLVETARRKLEG